MRFTDSDHSVIYDSIAKANRYLSRITNASPADESAVKELRFMAEDLLNSLENIEIYEVEESQ